ncbi:hypothetical protein EXN66_Car021120 [Channa argus]|uniref:Uncharacterized protein n=1 Tax=Channa argus TaxID=215402 RepID=A0A6G1QSY1_CHAAH|nr:hypothetical protein EXN66_Car021120 [Channa argus]
MSTELLPSWLVIVEQAAKLKELEGLKAKVERQKTEVAKLRKLLKAVNAKQKVLEGQKAEVDAQKKELEKLKNHIENQKKELDKLKKHQQGNLYWPESGFLSLSEY